MENFVKLFGRSIRFTYHCFDRIVIRGYLSTLSRPENLVYFFRNVKKEACITKELLKQRTEQYLSWLKAYTQKNDILMDWAKKDVRKKDSLEALCIRMQRSGRTGVYRIIKSMEKGPTFRIVKPKYPTKDPNWRLIAKDRSRYTHIYFYIIDDIIGPFSIRIGTYYPFEATYYLNGHNLIAQQLTKDNIGFRMKKNAFVSISDVDALQSTAEQIDPKVIQDRLDYWTFKLGPKFSRHERDGFDLRRYYFLSQVEYAQNFIFKRNHIIHSIFERSCDLGIGRISANCLSNIFGWRITKQTKGKIQVVLEQLEHGHHILRAYLKNSFVKQYEKFCTFLRIETCSNNLRDFYQKKSLMCLNEVARILQAVNNRFMDTQIANLNVEPNDDFLERLAQPCSKKSRRYAGIQLHNDRIIRLLEALMHYSVMINGVTSADLHQMILDAYNLNEQEYTRKQLAYDLRKLIAHGIIDRLNKRYAYVLSDYGRKAAAMLVIVRNRILHPLAGSIFVRQPDSDFPPSTPLQKQYRKTCRAFNDLVAHLKAA